MKNTNLDGNYGEKIEPSLEQVVVVAGTKKLTHNDLLE